MPRYIMWVEMKRLEKIIVDAKDYEMAMEEAIQQAAEEYNNNMDEIEVVDGYEEDQCF